jgi:alpha,alpha-trehalase
MATQPAAAAPRTRGSVDDHGVFDDAKTYYTADERHNSRAGPRTRTYSQVCRPFEHRTPLLTRLLQNSLAKQFERLGLKEPFRRGSHGKMRQARHVVS